MTGIHVPLSVLVTPPISVLNSIECVNLPKLPPVVSSDTLIAVRQLFGPCVPDLIASILKSLNSYGTPSSSRVGFVLFP